MASVETLGLDSEDFSHTIRRDLNEAIFGSEDDPSEGNLADIESEPEEILADDEIDRLLKAEIANANSGVASSLQIYLDQISKVPLLNSLDKEIELAKRIERGDKKAEHQLAEANLRLVVSIAKNHKGRGVEFLDLIQEGNFGLMKAVVKYDWRKRYKFSTYATWWVRQAVQRGVGNHSRTIRVPIHVSDRIKRIKWVQNDFSLEHKREPTREEIAEGTGLPLHYVEGALGAAAVVTSLNKPVGGEEDGEFGDLQTNKDQSPTDEVAFDKISKQHLRKHLDALPERERRILELRFGFEGQPWTLDAVGKDFGITRERVRQLENQALKRLAALHKIPYEEDGKTNGKPTNKFKLRSGGQVNLSDSEVDVLNLYKRYGVLTFPDIAKRLGLTVSQVKVRFNRIKLVLEVSSREEVVATARSMTKIEK